MQIDKYLDYKVGKFTYRNFVTLSKEEQLMVLRERNNPAVKKWMFTQEDIREEDHLRFIEGLKERTDAYYWLMLMDGNPVGVLSLLHCDEQKASGEPGYYLFADYADSGVGLEMHYCYKKLFFEEFGLEVLPGYILVGNTSAYQLACFFGAERCGTKVEEGRTYVAMQTRRERFLQVEGDKLASRFVRFLKSNKVVWE